MPGTNLVFNAINKSLDKASRDYQNQLPQEYIEESMTQTEEAESFAHQCEAHAVKLAEATETYKKMVKSENYNNARIWVLRFVIEKLKETIADQYFEGIK